jgi:hypothetical protein
VDAKWTNGGVRLPPGPSSPKSWSGSAGQFHVAPLHTVIGSYACFEEFAVPPFVTEPDGQVGSDGGEVRRQVGHRPNPLS